MRILIDQLDQSLNSGNYFLSLFTALTVPDIAGAMDSENGFATGDKYKAWYEQWVRPRFKEKVLSEIPPEAKNSIDHLENPLDGESCYLFRCSLLHQGRTSHPNNEYSKIIFIEPGSTSNVIHYGVLDDTLCIDLARFCNEIISGVNMWLDEVEESDLYKENYEKFVKRYPDGLEPYIVGVPVVG